MICYHIYFLYDSEDTLLYIGKSTSVVNRLRTHLSKENAKKHLWTVDIDKTKVTVYLCKSETDLDIYESYFINKYKPKHNKDKNFSNPSTFELPYLEPLVLLTKEDGLRTLYLKATAPQKKSLLMSLYDSSSIKEDLKPYVCTDIDFGYYIMLSKMRKNTGQD